MSDKHYSKDEQKAYEMGEHRAELFDKSNALGKATWDSLDKSNMTEEEREAYDKGVEDYKENN